MEHVGPSEVLDHGSNPSSRGRTVGVVVTTVVAAGLALAAIGAGMTWWAARPPVSTELAITGLSVIGTDPVTVVAEPPVGALATPAGAALPGVTLRLAVGGDPARSTELIASPTDAIVYVKERPVVNLAPGAFTEVDLTVAPVDCALAREGTDLNEAGYRWRRAFGVELLTTAEGVVVPLSEQARASFGEALVRACADAGEAPELTVVAARRGGEPPLETISLIVDVAAMADRLVITPLDGPGLRGLGAADRRSGQGIPLLWLVSPRAEHNDDVPTAYTQVFVVRGGTAYPWILGTPITEDLPTMTPLTTSIR
ncbi:MAG: hypothetical protein FJW85_10565 [Actinobacteria bacterium]|nr:hypothetical protein [Actinomycetota bacterium]